MGIGMAMAWSSILYKRLDTSYIGESRARARRCSKPYTYPVSANMPENSQISLIGYLLWRKPFGLRLLIGLVRDCFHYLYHVYHSFSSQAP